MKSQETIVRFTSGLGLLSVFGIAICALALTDIRHGGEDLRAEWQAVQVGFGVIALFHAAAFAACFKFFAVVKQSRKIILETRKDG